MAFFKTPGLFAEQLAITPSRTQPVSYPGRPAPHIHFKVKMGDREILTSQINIAGHRGNKVDHVVLEGICLFDRELLMTDFEPESIMNKHVFNSLTRSLK